MAGSAARSPSAPPRQAHGKTIGRKRLTLTGGQSEIVRVALIATGQRLLTRLHKLPAELTVMDGTKKLSRQSLTFRAAEKKKKP